MASLPQFQSDDRTFQMMQNSWATQINPLLNQPLSKALLLKNVFLNSGDNVVNHLLGRQQQGWVIADQDGVASVYRSAPLNSSTLTLNSSAPVTVSLLVF